MFDQKTNDHEGHRILKNVLAIRDTLWAIEDILTDWDKGIIDKLIDAE